MRFGGGAGDSMSVLRFFQFWLFLAFTTSGSELPSIYRCRDGERVNANNWAKGTAVW